MAETSQTKSPQLINRLQAGVAPAFALLAGMQLEVFSALADGPATATQIAERLALSEERLSRLLHALVVSGLLEWRDGRFANAPEAQDFLVKGRPGYMGDSHELTADIWKADLRTAESIRTGKPAALHDFSNMGDEALSAFLRGLVPYAVATGRELAETFDFSHCSSVIDIGGGSGAALFGLLERNPGLQGILFDLPRVARCARPIIGQTALAKRIGIESGDILAAPPSGRHDAAIVRALIQVLSAGDAARALAHTCQCLRPGGTIYITGSGILNDDRFSPAAGVLIDLTLMNFYPGGGAYTIAQHFRWLAEAGCADPRHRPLSNGSFLISATKL